MTPEADNDRNFIWESIMNYLSVIETSKLLGVSIRTLNRWSAQRVGPPRIKIGRAVRYRPDAVHEWMAANEQQPVRKLEGGMP